RTLCGEEDTTRDEKDLASQKTKLDPLTYPKSKEKESKETSLEQFYETKQGNNAVNKMWDHVTCESISISYGLLDFS
nr:hypothetical protein [Tanacetum cinerariifolium]